VTGFARLSAPAAGAAVPLLLLGAWMLSARNDWLPEQILPDPMLVLQTLREHAASGELKSHTLISVQRVVAGFALGAAAGLALGAAIGLSERLRGFLEPPFLVLSQVHVLGCLPLLVLLVGIDEEMKVLVIAWAALVPMSLNTAQSMRDVPLAWHEVGRVLTFDPWYSFTRIVMPAALPGIFTGLRESLANAWQAMVVAELFASSEGLGYLMVWGRQLFQLDIVLMAVIVVGAIGLALNWTLGRLELRLHRWQGQPA
jgi:sulfonate transport system permease protein